MSKVTKTAVDFVKKEWKKLVSECCDLNCFPASEKPVTIFMAGCPGVGKTEYSKGLVKKMEDQLYPEKFIRLDVDELRDIMPGYNKKNSDEVQPACSKLFTKIYDHIRHNNQNVVIDGTFSGGGSLENVERALARGRSVGITYLYEDPFLAWDYSKKREILEGRSVSKKYFTTALFDSIKKVNEVKAIFKNKVVLDIFIKGKDNSFKKSYFNIENLKDYIKLKYTSKYLIENLPDHV